MWILIY